MFLHARAFKPCRDPSVCEFRAPGPAMPPCDHPTALWPLGTSLPPGLVLRDCGRAHSLPACPALPGVAGQPNAHSPQHVSEASGLQGALDSVMQYIIFQCSLRHLEYVIRVPNIYIAAYTLESILPHFDNSNSNKINVPFTEI